MLVMPRLGLFEGTKEVGRCVDTPTDLDWTGSELSHFGGSKEFDSQQS